MVEEPTRLFSRLRRHRKHIFVLLVECLFVLPFIAGVSLNCAHTVDYETVHDTDTLVHRDTLHPSGPAFLRFLAVTDNKGTISLRTSRSATAPWLVALPQMDLQYVPVRSDSSFTLFAEFNAGTFPGSLHHDSIFVPGDSLTPFSLRTIVVFQTRDTLLFPYIVDDSMKKVVTEPGYCYIRFVNGLPDFPQPTPSVYIHLDGVNGTPVFKDAGGNDEAISYQSVRNYAKMPAGGHTLFARSVTNQDDFYTAALNFESGKFYTARLVGLKSNGTDVFVIDAE
jgi:hypothetical protein